MSDNPFVGTLDLSKFFSTIRTLNTDFNKFVVRRRHPRRLPRRLPLRSAAPSAWSAGNWSLNLHGSIGYGSPGQVRFQGRRNG